MINLNNIPDVFNKKSFAMEVLIKSAKYIEKTYCLSWCKYKKNEK